MLQQQYCAFHSIITTMVREKMRVNIYVRVILIQFVFMSSGLSKVRQVQKVAMGRNFTINNIL